MDFTEKLNLYKISDELELGLFNLDGIGEFLYVKDVPKNEKFYKSISIKRNMDLLKWVKFYVRKLRINVNTYLDDYSSALLKLFEEGDDVNRYFLSLSSYMPDELIDLALYRLGIKEIIKDPENSRIWIINFNPYIESHIHSCVWNFVEQSEDVLRNRIEKILIELEKEEKENPKNEVLDKKFKKAPLQKRLNMIVYLILNKRNSILEKEVIQPDDKYDAIKLMETTILSKFADFEPVESLQTFPELFQGNKEELELIKENGYKNKFYYFKYAKNNMELNLLKLTKSATNDDVYISRETKEVIRFSDVDDLVLKILEINVEKGIIKNLLTDEDKINLKEVLERLYLSVHIPYDKLEREEDKNDN